MVKQGLQLSQGIEALEQRFLSEGDKDFLNVIIDSILKGQRVQVKKIRALQQELAHTQNAKSKGPENHILNPNLSTKDKENIKQIHVMFAEEYSRKHVERIYVTYGRDFQQILEMFVSGSVPKEEADVQIII